MRAVAVVVGFSSVALLAAVALAEPAGLGFEIPLDPVPEGGAADADAGADARRDAREAAGFVPDPTPMVTRHQWVLDLAWSDGQPALRGARRVELAKPTPTPRMMGRFAVELWIGHELLERYRFDFPLLAADELTGVEKRPWGAPPSFERKLTTRLAVMLPHSDRATRAVLVDRATGRTWPLPFPFDADAGALTPAPEAPAAARDASADAPGGG